jgi:hypothetical protein
MAIDPRPTATRGRKAGRDWRAAASLLCALLGLAAPCRGDELADIIRDLETRRSALRSVKYVVEGTVLAPKGCYSAFDPIATGIAPSDGPIPSEDYSWPMAWTLYLDFQQNRVRKEEHSEMFSAGDRFFYPVFEVCLADGGRVQRYTPRDANTSDRWAPYEFDPDLSEHRESFFGFFEFADEPLLWAHGRTGGQGRPRTDLRGTIREAIQSLEVRGRAEIDGIECIVLRTSPAARQGDYSEFWLAPALDSALLRMSLIASGKELNRSDIEYRQAHGGWYPSGWTSIYLHGDGSIMRSQDVRVVEFTPDPPLADVQFRIEPTPGMVVYDEARDARYLVGEDGAWTDVKVIIALSEEAARIRPWIIGAAVFVAVAGAFVAGWAYRRGKTRRAEATQGSN